MSKPPSVWSARNREHQAYFARLLKPAVRASATTLFDDDQVGQEVVQAWIMQLHDVPQDLLEEGFAVVFGQGITWMPKPGEVRKACADIIAARRRQLAERARALMEACEVCTPDQRGFREVVDAAGVTRLARCVCHTAALALQAEGPAALALPPGRDDQATGSPA